VGALAGPQQGAGGVLAARAPAVHDRVRALADRTDLDYPLGTLARLPARSREGLRRIQQIVKALRDFARPDGGDLVSADLNAGIASTVNIILGRAKRQGTEVVTDLHPLPLVTCQPRTIHQAVLNLLANAA